jgi:V/A-type H+-transporting ATPase subunit I
MALAKMIKGRIAVHKSVAEELAATLQSLGCCEFAASGSKEMRGGAVAHTEAARKRVESLLSDVRFVLRVLEPCETKNGGGAFNETPSLSITDLASQVDEEKFNALVEDVREMDRTITEGRTELSRLRGLLTQLDTFASLKYPLEIFTSGTDTVSGVVYSIPKASKDELFEAIAKETSGLCEIEELPADEKDANFLCAIICRKQDIARVSDTCASFAGNKVEIPKDFTLTAADEKKNLEAKIAELQKKDEEFVDLLGSKASEGLKTARACSDYWTILRDRFDSMLSGLPTDEVLIWSFWLPQDTLEKVQEAVKPFDSLVQFDVVAPEEDEVPPTLLKNASWSSNVEPLTLMYGTPTYGAVDPTSLMAPFFFVFLGMCFGDAGYGLLLTGIFGYFLVKHKMSGTLRNFFIMLTIGMLCTTVMGALTGSWFGDSIDTFPFLSSLLPIKNALKQLDPMNDPMTLLLISLGLGFIQVIFGLLIAFVENWSSGERFAAFADQGGWIIFLMGLLFFGIGASGKLPENATVIAKYVAIAGAVILVLTQGREKKNIFAKLFSGVLSLYNVTGYLGDVLSYSRLLALGLGSAAVGMVINLLAKLVVGAPYVGIPAAILIFVLGHAFSIAVNLLGAFIHSLRLQYVEFFGKFYDANGRDFNPLRNVTRFSNVHEEGA